MVRASVAQYFEDHHSSVKGGEKLYQQGGAKLCEKVLRLIADREPSQGLSGKRVTGEQG